MNKKQYSFSEMSRKTVINVADGRELGHVCDIAFNNCGGVLGFIVPGKKSFFKSITSSDNIFIPWNRIIKIGSDVILTELCNAKASSLGIAPDRQPPQGCPDAYEAQEAEAYDAPRGPYSQQCAPSSQTVYHTDGKPVDY